MSGVGIVATPDLERSFGASHALATAVLFLVPGIVAFLVEPILFVLADKYPRRWFIRGGVAAMAVSAVIAALARGPVALACALSIMYIAVGASSALGQATLVDGAPDARGRTIARFTLLSLAGDLAAPLLLAVLAIGGFGWRAAYAVVAVALAIWAIGMWFARIEGRGGGDDDDDAGPSPGVMAALKMALTDRTLLFWLFATSLCDLLDEILVVLASIHVRDDFGASAVWQTATIVACVAGDVVGLLVLDRVLRTRPERTVLAWSAGACAVAYGAWLLAPTPLAGVILMVPVGVFAGPLYPLASAQAYAQRPEASGAVLAASHLFTPLGLALPFLLGALADYAGSHVALAMLLVQPLGLVALTLLSSGNKPDSRSGS